MQAKTKEEKKIFEWSKKLKPITKAQKDWGFKNIFKHYVYRTNAKCQCFNCGHEWNNEHPKDTMSLIGCTCPVCGQELQVRTYMKQTDRYGNKSEVIDRSWSYIEEDYMSVMSVYKDYQVIRHYHYYTSCKRGKAREWSCNEIVQDWISPKGKHTIVAHLLTSGPFGNYERWSYRDGLQIRKNSDKYSIDKLWYPRKKMIPEVDRLGIFDDGLGLSMVNKICIMLNDIRMEILYKNKQLDLLYHLVYQKEKLNSLWSSIKICIRNNYIIKDAFIWCDHMELLKSFGKDLRNEKYVCPIDLDVEHQHYNKKMEIINRRKETQRMLNEIEQYESIYEKHICKFNNLKIENKDFIIVPICSVYDFYLEGEILHHCVFNNEYFKDNHSLILSARINDTNRLETIQVNLRDFTISQSHGLCNVNSDYHDVILETIRKQLPVIRKMSRQKLSKELTT